MDPDRGVNVDAHIDFPFELLRDVLDSVWEVEKVHEDFILGDNENKNTSTGRLYDGEDATNMNEEHDDPAAIYS